MKELKILAEKFAKIGEIKVRETISTAEYKLKYFFCGWHTSEVIYAESDAEAIYDAERSEMKAQNKLAYALFCGNRIVKKMNYTGEPYRVIR